MDEIESIWEKVRSAAKGGKETEWRDRKSPIRFVSRERVAKTPTLEVTARPARPLPSIHDSKDGIFLKFVFRAKLPQNVLSDGVRIWQRSTNSRTYLNWRSSHRNAIFMVGKVKSVPALARCRLYLRPLPNQ